MSVTAQIAAELGVPPEELAHAVRHRRWRRGDLSWWLSDIQRRARAMIRVHRRPVWCTNRRFGKGRTAVDAASETALDLPGVWIPYAAGTREQVKTFVHPHMIKLANEAPPDLAPELVAGDLRFPPAQWHDAAGNPVRTRLAGGVELARFRGASMLEREVTSIIRTAGCENTLFANRLRGPGTPFGVVDEARDIRILDYVISIVIGPMLWEARSQWGEGVTKSLLVCSTPAEDFDHPFAEMVATAEAEGRLLHATIYDCDHISPRDIEEAKADAGGEDSRAWRREALAIHEPDPDRTVLPEMTVYEALVVQEHPRPAYFLPHEIGDAGFDDLDVVAFGYYDFVLDLDVIEDEVVMQHARSDTLDAKVAAKERELWAQRASDGSWTPVKVHRRQIDAQPKVRADMSREDFQAEDPEDAVRSWQTVRKDRGQHTGSKRASANAMRVRISRGRLRIHPRCKTIIAHAKGARWSQGGTGNELKRVKDEKGHVLHHYDGCDALLYFGAGLDRTTNPFPAYAPGVTLSTHHLRPVPSADRKLVDAVLGRRR